jgi:flagellum-specific peptidoglycan hydrolase FlgJ
MLATLKYWREIVLVLAIAALVALGWEARAVIAERDAATSKAAQAEQLTTQTQAARAKEHATAASDAAASAQYQKGLEDGKQDLDGALNRLRAALRLRDQQLAAARAGNLPAAVAGAGRRDGEARSDFLAAYGEDALRLAAEADDVVQQLFACQAIVESDRALLHNSTGE